MKILIVDDELVSRKKLKKIVGFLGECLDFSTGDEAIDAFRTAWERLQPFDLICLDINMPEMDGYSVLSSIRELEAEMDLDEEAKTKVIMVTAQSDAQSVAVSIKAGCDAYIVKPFNPAVVRNKINQMFDR